MVGGDGVDRTWGYAVSLLLVPAPLDWRHKSPGGSLGLEMGVSPTDGVNALSLGLAGSLAFLRLGVGAIWHRVKIPCVKALDPESPTHASCNRVDPGTVLPSADVFGQKEGYHDPRLYISLSLPGWGPFTP